MTKETKVTVIPAKKEHLSDSEWQIKFDLMPTALQDKFNNIRKFLIDEAVSIFKKRHKLGKEVINIANDPGKYGKKAVETMAELLDLDPGLLYNIKLFAERYTDQQLEELIDLNLRHKRGAITWTHAAHLMRVDNTTERAKLQTAIVKEQLTVSQLASKIQESKAPKAISSKVGKPINHPRGFEGHLSQFEALGTKFLKAANDVWFAEEDDIVSTSDDLEDAHVTDRLITRVSNDISTAQSISISMDSYAKEMGRIRTKLEKRLEANEAKKTNPMNIEDDEVEEAEHFREPVIV